jgi:hypothetical protein
MSFLKVKKKERSTAAVKTFNARLSARTLTGINRIVVDEAPLS